MGMDLHHRPCHLAGFDRVRPVLDPLLVPLLAELPIPIVSFK